MAAPVLELTYPADNDVGIPLGSELILEFSRAVDLSTIRKYIAIYGAATDQVSGPDPGTFLSRTGERPYLFRSPGFKGLVPFEVTGAYFDPDTGDAVDDTFFEPAEELDVAYRVTVTPTKPLAPEVQYQYQVIGDPGSKNVGISARTVWTPVEDITGSGLVEADGGYTGAASDDLVVQITTAGATGVAKYKWYWLSLGVNSGKSGRLSHTGYLTLDKGVAVRFSGTDFQVGDNWSIRCSPAERLEDSYKISFTTTDNEYTTSPDSPSTPATSSPPSTVIPPAPGMMIPGTSLSIVGSTPEDGEYNVSVYADRIEIEFSEALDPDSVTTETVRLYTLPAEGIYAGRGRKNSLVYSLEVDDNVIIIRF